MGDALRKVDTDYTNDVNIKTYNVDDEMVKWLDTVFAHHAPETGQVQKYARIRDSFKQLGVQLATLCPESVELSQALISLQQGMFWANAAIARNEQLIESTR